MKNELLNKNGKPRGGRPAKQTMNDTRLMKERRQALKFDTYIEDIDTEIASLRTAVKESKDGRVHAGVVNCSKAIIHARLAMISKCLPDIKSVEITGQVAMDHQHSVEPTSDVELAMRLVLAHRERAPAIEALTGKPVSMKDLASAMVKEATAPKIIEGVAEVIKPDPHPFL